MMEGITGTHWLIYFGLALAGGIGIAFVPRVRLRIALLWLWLLFPILLALATSGPYPSYREILFIALFFSLYTLPWAILALAGFWATILVRRQRRT